MRILYIIKRGAFMEPKNNETIVLRRENGLLLSLLDVSQLASPLAEKAKEIVAHALFELFADDFDGLFAKNGTEEFSKVIVEAISKRELEYIRGNKELFDNYIKANEEQFKKDKKDPYFKDRDNFEDFYHLYLLSGKFTILVKKENQVLVLAVDPLKEQPKQEEPVVTPEPEPAPVVEEKKEEPEPEPAIEPQPELEPEKEPEPEEKQEEPVEEGEPEVDQYGNVISITRRTFEQKLRIISDEYVNYYEEIREEALLYGLKSRVSNNGDAFSYKRINYLKIGISGRTLKLHYRLNPKDYAESPIPVEDDSSKTLYVDIPLAFRVKSKLAVKRAKHLLGDAMKQLGLKKMTPEELAKLEGEEEPKKEPEKKEEPKPEPKPQPKPKKVEKKPEPVKEEKPVIVVQDVEDEEDEEENEKGFPNLQKRTFYEKLLRVRNETRHAYKEIKDYGVETYGLTSRVGATGDSLSFKRKNYVKLQIFGKTLKVRYRLNPKDYAESKIPVDDDSDKKIYEDLPLSFKVRSDLAMKRAKKLIDDAMKAAGIAKKKAGK